MAPSKLPGRTVRPGAYGDEPQDEGGSHRDDVGSDDEDGSSLDEGGEVGKFGQDEDMDEDVDSGSDPGDVQNQMSNVSFGALAKAQDSLARKRKRGSDTNEEQEEKLQSIRGRLQELRERKEKAATKPPNKSKPRITTTDAPSDSDDASDSDSPPSEEGAPSKSRSSKHAPASQTSKRQVTRKRTVVDAPQRKTRDPRFDGLHQPPSDPNKSANAYSFLRDYQKSEIAQLKTAMKATGNDDDKEVLKRKIGAMENRIRAKEAKEKQQEVLREHRREERKAVGEGKTPYYLKQKELKERVLKEKYQGMKGKEREKAIEKRRRKEGQKEKKRMPDARRAVG